jgi:hypothetical protein
VAAAMAAMAMAAAMAAASTAALREAAARKPGTGEIPSTRPRQAGRETPLSEGSRLP